MMTLAVRAHCALKVAGCLVRHPSQTRWMLRWWHERRASPIELGVPWWPYTAVRWLGSELTPGARAVELGAGGSTVWLARKGVALTSAEYDDDWVRQVRKAAPGATVVACALSSYPELLDREPDASLDLVIVDGGDRVECVRRAMPKVRPGGFLLLDDSARPQYSTAVTLLASWTRRDFSGLKPGDVWPSQTSVWKRPEQTRDRQPTTSDN